MLMLGITAHCVAVPELFHFLSPFPGLHLMMSVIWSGAAVENSNTQI